MKGANETLTGGYTLDIQEVARDAIPAAAVSTPETKCIGTPE